MPFTHGVAISEILISALWFLEAFRRAADSRCRQEFGFALPLVMPSSHP
jgi:hypothetical protein